MTTKEIKDRDQFTSRTLMALATARADGNRRNARILIEALCKAHGLENYPPRSGG
jgi:hypothetical protein